MPLPSFNVSLDQAFLLSHIVAQLACGAPPSGRLPPILISSGLHFSQTAELLNSQKLALEEWDLCRYRPPDVVVSSTKYTSDFRVRSVYNSNWPKWFCSASIPLILADERASGRLPRPNRA